MQAVLYSTQKLNNLKDAIWDIFFFEFRLEFNERYKDHANDMDIYLTEVHDELVSDFTRWAGREVSEKLIEKTGTLLCKDIMDDIKREAK